MTFNKKYLGEVYPLKLSKKLNLLESSLWKPYCIQNQDIKGKGREGGGIEGRKEAEVVRKGREGGAKKEDKDGLIKLGQAKIELLYSKDYCKTYKDP